MTATAAPEHIQRDTHTGRWSRSSVPANHVVAEATAAEIAAAWPAEGVLWESFGHINGREHFGRTRYVADAAGRLHCYDSNGRKVIVHPADRTLRILGKR